MPQHACKASQFLWLIARSFSACSTVAARPLDQHLTPVEYSIKVCKLGIQTGMKKYSFHHDRSESSN